MKNDFPLHHTPDAIFFSVKHEEAMRIRKRMLQLKQGVNPHGEIGNDHFKTSSARLPAPTTTNDPYFQKKNKLRGKLRNIKFTSAQEMRAEMARMKRAALTELSPLDED